MVEANTARGRQNVLKPRRTPILALPQPRQHTFQLSFSGICGFREPLLVQPNTAEDGKGVRAPLRP
jgi:hypothetical protein